MMIMLLILITLSLDSVWILLGENCCWSLLALKGLKRCVRIGIVEFYQNQNSNSWNCHQLIETKKIFSTNIRNDTLLLNNPANTKIGQDGQT